MPRSSRLFARLDLDYADHPKIAVLSDAAFRAHVEMILYSRRYQTDGRIANRIANRWVSEVLTELQTNDPGSPSLQKLDDGDYLLHDYADMQETRAEIEAKRQVNAANGRLGGRPKKANKNPGANPVGKQTAKRNETEPCTEIKPEEEEEEEVTTPKGVAEQAPAQQLVAEWIDHCNQRPPGRVIGQVSKELKTMLNEGIPASDLRQGLIAWHSKGLHPSTLASVVHETRNPNRRPSTTDQRVGDGLSLVEEFRTQEQNQLEA